MRILVVDDSRALRELFARLLRSAGAAVAEADTARRALELASGADFDAVLSDLGLPDMGGHLLIERLLAMTPHLYVVVISGGETAELDRARAAGARVVFRKPVEWDQVMTTLREAGRTGGRDPARSALTPPSEATA
jgi:CheY-like chemotaxis protein